MTFFLLSLWQWTTLSIHQPERGSNRKFELVSRNGLEKYVLQVKLGSSPEGVPVAWQVFPVIIVLTRSPRWGKRSAVPFPGDLMLTVFSYLWLQAASKEIRDCWFSEISKLLMEQQNNNKGRVTLADLSLESYSLSDLVAGVQIGDC